MLAIETINAQTQSLSQAEHAALHAIYMSSVPPLPPAMFTRFAENEPCPEVDKLRVQCLNGSVVFLYGVTSVFLSSSISFVVRLDIWFCG